MKTDEKEEWEERGGGRWRDRETEREVAGGGGKKEGRDRGRKGGRASQGPQQRSFHPKVPGSA